MSATVTITWAPLLAWPLLAVLAGLAALVAGFALWRRARGAVWRTLAALAILGLLANPTLVREQREALPDIALVVVDESASQDIGDRPEQTEAIMAELDQRWPSLRDTEVRVIRAGAAAAADPDAGPAAGAGGTRLFRAVRQALGEIPEDRLAGVVLVSDGQIHDAPEDRAALGVDAPVHLLLTGESEEGDRRIIVHEAPSYGIVGKSVSLTVEIADLPTPEESRTAEIRIARDGGQVVRRTVPVGERRRIELPVAHRGRMMVEVSAEPGPRELTLANNRAAVAINGVRDRLRVLLVSGEPHAGERAWRHLLKSDPSVDLVHFTILRPPSKQDGTPIDELSLIAFPTRELFEVKIDDFDLIVFDRYKRRGVLPQLYLDNVAAYVRDGGALLEASGPSFAEGMSLFRSPLGAVLPGRPTGRVFEQPYRPAVTDLGRRHPVTAKLPQAGTGTGDGEGSPQWGRWFRHLEVEARGGDVLMQGVRGHPLLILQEVGEGRVAQLLSDHVWLWRRGYDGGGPQAELMRRIAHWLMKEPELAAEDLDAEVREGRLTVTRRSLTSGAHDVTVTGPQGERRTLTLTPDAPGEATGILSAKALGVYEVQDGDRTALAAAGALNPKEYRDVRATDARLGALLRDSGGAAVRYAEAGVPRLRKVRPDRERSGAGWIGLVDHGAYRVTGVAELPLLPPVLALILAGGLMVAAWVREAR